jgi:prepilin peptidase CpaA
MPSPLHVIAALLCILVIGYDVRTRRVPNGLLLIALGLGGCWFLWSGIPDASFGIDDALRGLAIGLMAMLPFHVVGVMGAGDVKFFAVLGFLLGWHLLLPIWIVGSLLCGLHAIVVLILRQAGPALACWQSRLPGSRYRAMARGQRGLPYAAHLGMAAVLAIFGVMPAVLLA